MLQNIIIITRKICVCVCLLESKKSTVIVVLCECEKHEERFMGTSTRSTFSGSALCVTLTGNQC